jgi:hypothetical protein
MLGKVRLSAHDRNGSEAGLSEGRLALVHRYMIDAEEAEARAQLVAQKPEEPARVAEQARAASGEHAGREAAERRPIRPTTERRRAEKLVFEEEKACDNGRPDAKEEGQARKALARAEKRAAKQAAQRIATLEKREARERKALAKAAARRRTR